MASSYPQVDFSEFPPVAVLSEPRPLSFTAAPVALADAAATLTVAQLQNGTLNATAFTAGRVLTLPTAAQLVASLPGSIKGSTLTVSVICGAGGAATLAVGAGGSLLGNAVVLASASGQFRVRLTDVSSGTEAYQLQRVA
jgi:hypothetical protein